MWQQRQQLWQGLSDNSLSPWRYATVILLMFGIFSLLFWQVGALSMTLVQPYLENAQAEMVVLQVLPKDLISWSMNSALTLWLLIACMALGINAINYDPKASLLSTRFKHMDVLARYAESLLLVGSLTAFYVLTFLLVLQLSKTLTVMAGFDQVTVPYMGIGIFIIVLYVFNVFYAFGKRHRADAKNPKRSLAYLHVRQLGFYVLAWTLSIIVTLCLPEGFKHNLSEPLGIALLSPETYAYLWQLSVIAWGLCCVPVLSMLLARYASKLPVLQSSSLMILLPLSVYLMLSAALWGHGTIATLFHSELIHSFVPLTEQFLIFQPSFLSITAGLSTLVLLAILKYCPELTRAWLSIMPVHSGRRILRLKKHMAYRFGTSMMLYVLYLMMGSIALAFLMAGYLLSITMYIILHLGQGLVVSLSLPKTPLQWKRGVGHGYH